MLAIGGDLVDLLAAPLARLIGSKRVIAGPAAERPEYIRELAELATSGALRPVVDRRYDFLQIAEAHAYVATRRKRGSVVVSVAPV